MTAHAEEFSATAAATGALAFTYVLSGPVSITTTVTGDARQYATVGIVNGSLTLWSTTLTQLSPTAEVPYDVVAGQLTIKQGGTFTLTIPTTIQQGQVAASLMIATPTTPKGQPFAAAVANWSLSSA
jgi:hypothetical protein